MSSVLEIPVMTDIETFGLKQGNVILSIAMVPFKTPFPIEPFYVKINVDSSLAAGFIIDEETVQWWSEQDIKVFEEATSGTTSIHDALTQLSEWINKLPGNMQLYGNSAAFDNEMIKAAYEKCGIPIPWSYKQDRCYRTLFNLFKGHVQRVKPSEAHNALADATAQAAQCQKILEWIDEKSTLKTRMLNIINQAETLIGNDKVSLEELLNVIEEEINKL